MKQVGSMTKAIIIALEKGYKITDDGVVIGLKGKPLKIKLRGLQRYPTFSVSVGDLTNSGVYGIPVHKFAAYVFFGEHSQKNGFVVRHLDGNTLNNSKDNLLMGTHSENNMDKPREVRVEAAKKARAAQGRPTNRRFTDEQVSVIKKRLRDGVCPTLIAEESNVTKQCIYLIRNGRNYSDVK